MNIQDIACGLNVKKDWQKDIDRTEGQTDRRKDGPNGQIEILPPEKVAQQIIKIDLQR